MNDGTLLSYSVWLSTPQETRRKLVTLFDIPRTGESIVRVGQIINGNISGEAQQDGHSPSDLRAVSLVRMQELLGVDNENFYSLFKTTVDNIDDLLAGTYVTEPEVGANPSDEIIEEVIEEVIEKVELISQSVPFTPNKGGRPKDSKNKKKKALKVKKAEHEESKNTEATTTN